MLTPAFDLSQNDDFLILKIKAPYTKVSETELFFEGSDFRFYSKPYFLRLHLPGAVVENGSESVTYCVEDGSYSIRMPKACPGEWFEGLDLQTKLLTPKGRVHAGPLIQVLDNNNSTETNDEEDEDEFDWEIYQNQYTDQDPEDSILETVKYGFASQKTDLKLFARLQEEMPDLLDVRIRTNATPLQRKMERISTEAKDFSEEHYLADLYDNSDIQVFLDYKPYWFELEQKIIDNTSMTLEEIVVFTEEEKSRMRNLPNKEYLLEHATKQEAYLGLVDILFAYAYNVRTTEGENTVESAWTICKIGSTLSWLETFPSLESVAVSSVRRSLCYPLYRQWNLSLVVLNDTIKILSLGPRFVLKCLLEIHELFNESEPRYIFNDLYITDYCVWIQTVKTKVLFNLAAALKKVSISKSSVDLDLFELEKAAELVQQEEDTAENVTNKLGELDIKSASSQTDCSSDTSDQDSLYEEDSSDSDSSYEESSSSLDSDDYSSTQNSDSSDDDDDSDPNEASAENCLLLGNIHSIEKIR